MFGAEVGAGGEAPTMVSSSQKTGEDSLLRASLETNPLDKLCDQRLALTANSLTIVYNAVIIIIIIIIIQIIIIIVADREPSSITQ